MCVFAAPNYADMENCSECSKDARSNKCNKCTKCGAAFHKDCNKSNIIIDAAKSIVLCKKCVDKITNERDSYRSELTQDKLKIDSLNEELTDLRNENIELKNIIAKITSMENDLKWLKEQVTSNSNRLDQTPSFEQPSSSPTNPNPHPSNTNLEQKIFDSFYEITDREKRKLNLVVKGLSERDHDAEQITELFKHELVTEVDPANLLCKRIGRVGRYPRPILVTLPNMITKKQILSNSANLRNYRTSVDSKVFISPDLTPKQRAINKALREQVKIMRDNGHSVKIYRGEIVSSASGTRPPPLPYPPLASQPPHASPPSLALREQ